MCDDETIDLSIRDNGMGFDLEQSSKPGGHLGLLSMKERVRLAQGKLVVESTPGQGTHIRVGVPLTQGGRHV